MTQKTIPEPVQNGIKALRLSIDDLIALAYSGDKQAARTLLARYNHVLWQEAEERKRGFMPNPNENREKLKAYISGCISASLKNDDANSGFNFSKSGRGRRELNYLQREKELRIAIEFAGLGVSETKAKKIIAKKYHISQDKALMMFKKYFPEGWN